MKRASRVMLMVILLIGISASANAQTTLEKIERDTERDYFMSAEEATEYGIVDRVIDSH